MRFGKTNGLLVSRVRAECGSNEWGYAKEIDHCDEVGLRVSNESLYLISKHSFCNHSAVAHPRYWVSYTLKTARVQQPRRETQNFVHSQVYLVARVRACVRTRMLFMVADVRERKYALWYYFECALKIRKGNFSLLPRLQRMTFNMPEFCSEINIGCIVWVARCLFF